MILTLNQSRIMYYRNLESNRNICRSILLNGGDLIPLLISTEDSGGLGLMNPSVLVDKDDVIVNLRNVNYTLYHAEGKQLYNNRYGPLVYLHPEADHKLRTTNYVMRFNADLSFRIHHLIDTAKHDIEPIWDFVGLEDIRLVRWDNKLFGCGVRRDVKDDGEGRMELSELKYKGTQLYETSRTRIQPPGDPTYCEKNWMPVLDQPYTFVKWTNPTQVVKVDMKNNSSETVYMGNFTIPYMPDLRGGSQVIPFRGHYICIVHDCDLFQNKLDQKDATYMHRWIVWDRDWNMVHISEPWSFMDGEIEFCCGLAEYENDLLVTFGFQDNAAYMLRIPEAILADVIEYDVQEFDWGITPKDTVFLIQKEIVQMDHYEQFKRVKEGDIVVDMGAHAGAFTKGIIAKKPRQVHCVEPSADLFPALQNNVDRYDVVTCHNVAITDVCEEGLSAKQNKKVFNQIQGTYDSITFEEFLKANELHTIHFLKVDVEGSEYDIFTAENKKLIERVVQYTVIEFHIKGITHGLAKFKKFRDTYLTGDHKFKCVDTIMNDVSEKIFDDSYLESLNTHDLFIQLMVYITF